MTARARAVVDAEDMRQTHVEWLEHEGCPRCDAEGLAEIVGDAGHHRRCIKSYDIILSVLRGEEGG